MRSRTSTPRLIGDVRGLGSMLVMEFVKDTETKTPWMEATAAVTAETVKRGVITIRAGLYSNCVRFLPALDITDSLLDEALDVVAESVDQVARDLGVHKVKYGQFIAGEWLPAQGGGVWDLDQPGHRGGHRTDPVR